MPPKDPSQMTDEELDAELGLDPAEEEIETPEEGKGEPAADDSEDDKDEPEEDEDEEKEDPGDDALIEEDDPKPPSRREQLRIRDILAKRQPTQPAATKATERLDYAQELNADPEVIQQLEADRDAAVAQASDLSTQTAESIRWDTMLRIDAQRVYQQRPTLDKTSENFNPRVSDSLNEMYLQMSGYDPQTKLVANPGISYGDFTDAMFELAEEMAGNIASTTSKTRSTNRANTGIRPGGGTAKKLNLNQAPEDMTDEELDAYIEQSMPRR